MSIERTQILRHLGWLILGLLLLWSWPAAAGLVDQRSPCTAIYTVQRTDRPAKIADQFLGAPLAFTAILAATNQQQLHNPAFARLDDPTQLKAGQQLCVPAPAEAAAWLTPAPTTAAVAPLEPGRITVFAAASLTEAFTELGRQFEAAHPGLTVTLNFAGSQQLAQQLGQGAPADLFAAANQTQMAVAIRAGRVTPGSEQAFVRNRLVIIYPADNPAGLVSLADLAKPGLRLILAAPAVPVGRYSEQFLNQAGQNPALGVAFKEGVLANVVSYEQNVKAVLAKIALGEGDAGIVYSSDITAEISTQVGQLEIPAGLNVIAAYPIAVTSDTAHPAQAQAFLDYVLGPAGQSLLAQFGFIPASQPGQPPIISQTGN